MSSITTIIQYLKDCYQADNREVGLSNFFGKSVEHQWLLPDAEILAEKLPIYPVDPLWGEKVAKTTKVYAKEKELMMAYIFLTAQLSVGSRNSSVATPLFLIPTTLELRDENYFIKPSTENASVNPIAVNLLNATVEEDTDSASVLQNWITREKFGFGDIGILREVLAKQVPHLQTEEMLMYPSLLEKKAILNFKKKKKNYLLPAAGLGVLRKSTTTLGILSELETLCQTDDYSTALLSLFDKSVSATSISMPIEPPTVPSVLSQAQVKAFAAIEENWLTQITGPPGTGKSFIIASMAIDCMSKGKSVLIVSANDQAVDVVHNKIQSEFQLEQIAVRGGGNRDYKSVLKKRLENWLNGMSVEPVDQKVIKLLEKNVAKLSNNLHKLEREYTKRAKQAYREGVFLTTPQNSWMYSVRKRFIGWRIKRTQSIGNFTVVYQDQLATKHRKIKELLVSKFNYRLHQSLLYHRKELQRFLSAIRARTSSKQIALFNKINFNHLSQTFPVWLVSITDISHILPMRKEMFDVVIVDEATQCDMASVLPILQRGKKVVVAGDPKQLRHVSFLAKHRQQQLAERNGLSALLAGEYNFRDHSLLDIANRNLLSQSALVFLNEHYRSQPSIIQFSNQHFYQNQLRIMTAQPQNERVQHVHLIRLSGKRHKAGHNQEEINFILAKISEIANTELPLMPAACQSIGILSPFRQQVDCLRKQVAEKIDIKLLDRHQILIGTPYTFQGEERDIMLISLAVDEEVHPSTFQILSREDVFNVSITRARSEQWIITSLHQPTGYAAASQLEKYINHIEQADLRLMSGVTSYYHDTFLASVVAWLREQGYQEIHQQYTIAGIEIDIVLVHQETTFCINLIGYPGEMEEAMSVEQFNILQRVGILAYPLSYSRWYFNQEISTKYLKRFLSSPGQSMYP
ncbi:AAA domain-containing protein [Tunicatimonas pelagia]|uniref:AAA domain-containing protein n=1 Tax=Tunicatimonas pelagia TaxID=931531 RepID=UPI0026651ED2|nr:AAA domain-containing protein [Tunicatimonas pelagia]WKN41178.1 AAA domain-containing protein [Tunicatimonas pelagia]